TPPPPPPSFPTRRSSDLTHPPLVERIRRIDPSFDGHFVPLAADAAPSEEEDREEADWSPEGEGALQTFAFAPDERSRHVGGGSRSEEHTSELQSRSDLVC